MNSDCVYNIFKFLGINGMINYCIISKYNYQFHNIIDNILTQRIKILVGNKLNIEYKAVDNFLIAFDCIISGSAILQCIINEYWESDIDIYINISKNCCDLCNFIENNVFGDNANNIIDNITFQDSNIDENKPPLTYLEYLDNNNFNNLEMCIKGDGYFIDNNNNIGKRHLILHKQTKVDEDNNIKFINHFAVARSDKVDIILCADKYDAIKSFDFSFLMSYYYGKQLVIPHLNNVMDKSCSVCYDTLSNKEKKKAYERIIKYNKRGFTVTLTQSVTIDEYNTFMRAVGFKIMCDKIDFFDICQHTVILIYVVNRIITDRIVADRINANLFFRKNKKMVLKYITSNKRDILTHINSTSLKIDCFNTHKYSRMVYNEEYDMMNNIEYFSDNTDSNKNNENNENNENKMIDENLEWT